MNVTANQRERYKVPLRGTRNESLSPTKWGLSASSPNSRDIYVLVPHDYSFAPMLVSKARVSSRISMVFAMLFFSTIILLWFQFGLAALIGWKLSI